MRARPPDTGPIVSIELSGPVIAGRSYASLDLRVGFDELFTDPPAEVLKLDFDVVIGASGGPRTRGNLEVFKNRIGTLVAAAHGLVRQGVSPDELAGRLHGAGSGWNARLAPDQLAAFHAELARRR